MGLCPYPLKKDEIPDPTMDNETNHNIVRDTVDFYKLFMFRQLKKLLIIETRLVFPLVASSGMRSLIADGERETTKQETEAQWPNQQRDENESWC